MTAITAIHAREVLDSRGDPTVEVEVWCGHTCRRAIVPSGASTGRAEAREIRDGQTGRYDGRGVQRAVANVERQIAPTLIGADVEDQQTIDRQLCRLDATPDKSRLGANAILGVSLAAAHAAAAVKQVPLYQHFATLWQAELTAHGIDRTSVGPPRMPLPMTNMISGGLHAGGNLDFQDFLVMPVGAATYPQGLEWIVRVYRRLGKLLADSGYEGRLVGDEGGYGPRLPSNQAAVELTVRAIEAADLRPGVDVTIALDVAATHFYNRGCYHLAATGQRRLTSEEMIDQLTALVDAFPVTSIEDGLAEDDWQGWRALSERLGNRVQLVGDDLFATNPQRLARGIELGAANSVLVKLNQIGTLSETLETMRLARAAGYRRVVSARSGETEDTTIADLAVGTAAEMIKIGSITRSERLAKYNQLLRIAEHLAAGSRPPEN